MEKYLPEWFNEEELGDFITEGPLTRQAWIKGLKRWARTKFFLRKMIGSAPAKYMSRVQRTKHAVMANAAIQNAREIEAARNREEMIQAKRNFIRQESFAADFEKYLEEKFTRGSQRAFNLGVHSSAGERADMKNPTGSPKVKAKLKKREQRKDMRRRGMKVESFMDMMFEEEKKEKTKEKKVIVQNRADPKDTADIDDISKGDFSRVLVVKTPAGNIQIITKHSNTEGNQILLGDRPSSINKADDLMKYVTDENFRVTPTARAIFKGRLDDLLEKQKQQKAEKKEVETADTRAKEVKPEIEKAVEDPMSIIPPSEEEKNRPHGNINKAQADEMFWLQDTIDGSPLADEIKKWLGQGKVDSLRMNLANNPGYFATSEKLRGALVDTAVAANPNLANKELVVIPFGDLLSCAETSDVYKSMGGVDNKPKTDVIVLSVEDGKKLLSSISGKNCAQKMAGIVANSFKASVKKGKVPAFATQAAETFATLQSVQIMLRDHFQGNIPMEIMKDLSLLMMETQKLIQLGTRSVQNIGPDSGAMFIRKAMSKSPTDKFVDPSDLNFYTNSTAMLKNMNDILTSFLSRKEVKATILLEQMSGISKFGNQSLGVADGLIMLDDAGNYTGKMILPKSLDEALQNEAFMKLVDDAKINIGRKSRELPSSMMGAQPNQPAANVMGQPNPSSPLLTASFDPVDDNKLDSLFEYTFSPPDVTISTMAPETPSGETQMPSSMMGFSSFQQEQDMQLNADNILAFLMQSGFIESLYADPLDFAELGMKISSMDSPIKNQITVNGRFFEIPVMNPNISESVLDQYEVLNEEMVHFVNEGMTIEEATEIFNEQLGLILEGRKRNYKREYRLFHGKAKERKKRSNRVLARRKMAKKYGKGAIAGKDIDHKDGNAMNNGDSNLRVRSINKNRADNGHSKNSVNEVWGAGLEGSWELTYKWLKETPGQLGLIAPSLLRTLMGNEGKAR